MPDTPPTDDPVSPIPGERPDGEGPGTSPEPAPAPPSPPDYPPPAPPDYPPPGYPPSPPPGYPPPPLYPNGHPPPAPQAPGYPPPAAGGWAQPPPGGFPPPPPPPGYGAAYGGPYGAPQGAPQWSPGYTVPVSPFASYGARVGGWLIDWLITSVIGAVVLLPLHAVRQSVVVNGSRFNVSGRGVAISALIVVIYATVFIGWRGQTPGMMAVRARAVDAAGGGGIGYGRALGRVVFEYLLAVVLFLPWIVDMLFPLWDQRRQTLHDKVTNTVVVKT
ncbi:MAG TPA: RDD family protein [Acidimicrobiales bacterium]|nr:RDD family protein [Acidimicrobiales bacterium]